MLIEPCLVSIIEEPYALPSGNSYAVGEIQNAS